MRPRMRVDVSRNEIRFSLQQQPFGDGGLVFELGARELFVFGQPIEEGAGSGIALGGGGRDGRDGGRLGLIGGDEGVEFGFKVVEFGGGDALGGEPVGVGCFAAFCDERPPGSEEVLLVFRFAPIQVPGRCGPPGL